VHAVDNPTCKVWLATEAHPQTRSAYLEVGQRLGIEPRAIGHGEEVYLAGVGEQPHTLFLMRNDSAGHFHVCSLYAPRASRTLIKIKITFRAAYHLQV